MTYAELKEKQQKEVSEFPLHFAFSEVQMREELKSMGLDYDCPEDLKKLVSIGAGGFMLKTDVKAFNEMFKRHKEEKKKFRKNEKEFIEAIRYEMANHEFIYGGDEEAIMSAVGIADFNDNYTVDCWNKALKLYKQDCYENDLL